MALPRGDVLLSQTAATAAWPSEAAALLERACRRHGLAAWTGTRSLLLDTAGLTGLLPWMKGSGVTFRFPSRIRVFPHEQRTEFLDYPDPGGLGVFDRNGSVRLAGEAGEGDHRRTFGPWSKYRRWSPLDALYFFGYAVLHYHSLPFTLGEAELLGSRRYRAADGARTALRVRFPPSRITHCAVQTFHFDDSGLLLRQDYTADVFGTWARGAHLWQDHRDVDGQLVAMRRRVLVRFGSATIPVLALEARFAGASASPAS